MSAFVKLRESNFSATEKRIADYILQHAEQLPDMTISTVAEACDTSKSMVVQLCKAAGFKGYKDLCTQLMVEQALSSKQELPPPEAYDDLFPGCSVAQICQLILREEMRCLQDTLELMDFDAIDRAVQLLAQADRIQLFGVGSSAVAALDMYHKLCRIGMNVCFSQDVHCQLLETASMTAKGVALVFSFNGRTKDMIDACELSRDMGAKIITVTRFGNSPVSEMADVALHVASNESLRRVTTMSSRLSTLALGDVLFTCLSNQMSGKVQDIIQRNIMIANRRRK